MSAPEEPAEVVKCEEAPAEEVPAEATKQGARRSRSPSESGSSDRSALSQSMLSQPIKRMRSSEHKMAPDRKTFGNVRKDRTAQHCFLKALFENAQCFDCCRGMHRFAAKDASTRIGAQEHKRIDAHCNALVDAFIAMRIDLQ